jgi:hypothetical protein
MREKLFENLKTIKGVSFISITYTNKQNEKSTSVVNIGVDYDNAKLKDIEYLKDLDVIEMNSTIDPYVLEEARMDLLESFENPNQNRSKGVKDAYTHLGMGLKIHNESMKLFVYGMVVSKTILEAGDIKPDTRKPLTIAKDEIRANLKSTQYRLYEIGRTFQYKIKGDTIIIK